MASVIIILMRTPPSLPLIQENTFLLVGKVLDARCRRRSPGRISRINQAEKDDRVSTAGEETTENRGRELRGILIEQN
jgi:hypothetical protein